MTAREIQLPETPTARLCTRLSANIERVIRGQARATRWLVAGLVSGSHVLLEDLPGTGKTTLAKALAASIGGEFRRVQFTPDLLPADILGLSVYNQRSQAFDFHPGPVFTNLLLADEINRASPRTQSALLEAMAEGQVSIEGARHPLESVFFVVATQNPGDFHGTYPLPEAQMDRFALSFRLGYVSIDDEMALIDDQASGHPLDRLAPCATLAEIVDARAACQRVFLADELKRYITTLVAATRTAPGVRLGASPRATLHVARIARTLAAFDGLDFVTPDHVQEVAVGALAHRIALEPQARFAGATGERIVTDLIATLPVPA